MRILVLGATGLLGNALFKALSNDARHDVWGSIRSDADRIYFADGESRLAANLDVLNTDSLIHAVAAVGPDIIINAVGLVKQLQHASDPLYVIPINAVLPHRLASICQLIGARLVHISTDCVFSGRKGGYVESDELDAEDIYGRSKGLGEMKNLPHAITLRTSIIGHEPKTSHSLVDWFLSQEGAVKGFTRAFFSGLPVVELATVINDWILARPELYGVYHVSAAPISKYDLLSLIAAQYQKRIDITPDYSVMIDRSLDSSRFTNATGYIAPPWPELVRRMHSSEFVADGTHRV